jgi:hypothetical protein
MGKFTAQRRGNRFVELPWVNLPSNFYNAWKKLPRAQAFAYRIATVCFHKQMTFKQVNRSLS